MLGQYFETSHYLTFPSSYFLVIRDELYISFDRNITFPVEPVSLNNISFKRTS